MFLFACFTGTNAFAAAELRLGNDTNAPGGTVYLPVQLTADTNVVALQFDLIWADTNWAVGEVINEYAVANHVIQTNLIGPGALRLLITAPTNTPLPNGILFYVRLVIPLSTLNTNQIFSATNVILATYEGNAVTPLTVVNGTVTVIQGHQPAAPAILVQPPLALVAGTGGGITMDVLATGNAILRYQWLRNSAKITGATNTWLTLTNLSLADAGNYKVIISNGYGAATSRVSQLTVNLAPVMAWQQSFGGSGDDQLRSLVLTSDGGLLLGGFSDSAISGNKTNAGFGGTDYWLIRLDDQGNKLWERTYGGAGADVLSSVIATSDGGFLLGGWSMSGISGNKTSTNYGAYDFWVLKVDADGNQLWENSFGGIAMDQLFSMLVLSDGDFLIAGSSYSAPSGNKTSERFGVAPQPDYWLIKISSSGNKLWERTYGSSGPDTSYGLTEVGNGLYLLSGQSNGGPPGNKTAATYGGNDYWGVMVDFLGTNLWDHSYGGSGNDTAIGAVTNLDGGFLIGGYTSSGISGTKASASFGDNDFWIVNADFSGWEYRQQSFGGSSNDFLRCIETAGESGYYLGGSSASGVSGSKNTPNYGTNDFWLIKVDLDGYQVWEQDYGGTDDDQLYQVKPTADGGLLLGGTSLSGPSGNKTAINYGEADFWVVRLVPPQPSLLSQPTNKVVLSGTTDAFSVVVGGAVPFFYRWYHNGNPIPSGQAAVLTLTNIALEDAGNYFCVISNGNGVVTSQVATLSVTPAINLAPLVSLTAPADGMVITFGTNIQILANASDADGSITRVEFLANSVLLATFTNAPYALNWTNVTVGNYTLTAVAFDNLGSNTVSAPVTVSVLLPSGPAEFRLEQALYQVSETVSQVVIRVVKTNGGSGAINFATREGTAKALNNDGYGDYQTTSGSLVFAPLDTVKTITIPIVNDLGAEGDQEFSFELTLTGDGSSLGNPAIATIRILDDEPAPGLGSALEVRNPNAWPTPLGRVRMHLEPASSEAKWRFHWETEWRATGTEATGLEPGDYTVEFRPVSGSIAPVPDTFTLATGGNLTRTNYYVVSGQPLTGSLQVTLQPSGGRWRFQGQTTWYNSAALVDNIAEGEHVLEFEPVAGRVTPAPRLVAIAAATPATISVYYPPAVGSSGTDPALVQFTTIQNALVPYALAGQLFTSAGFSSGYVVKDRVILTAAHALFNEASLTFVSEAKWFFRRYKDQYEPLPQRARGWFVFGGYAAARSNSPAGQSTLDAYSLDVAAVYFIEPAGRTGYGGYLASDASKNWLTGSESKQLLGYPVSGKDGLVPGRLYATSQQPYSFEAISGGIFATAGFRSYPGNSGGPVCVLHPNGNWYPAGVYLGESGGQSIVRVIDTNVVDLINRAALSAYTGDNNTGGGVVTLEPGIPGTLYLPTYLQVALSPAEAVAAGAGWRLVGYPLTNYLGHNAQLLLLPGSYAVEFKPVAGWQTPTNRTAALGLGQTLVLPGVYARLGFSLASPGLGSNRVFSLGLSGEAGKVYVMEASTNLGQTHWTILATNTLDANGAWLFADPASTNLPARYYRAREK